MRRRRAAAALVMLLAATGGPAAAQAARPPPVTLAGGRYVGRDNTVRVKQGGEVRIEVRSDQPLSLHLHGYEVHLEVGPQAPQTLAFKADMPGRFPVHEHKTGAGNHRAVFFVEVLP